MSALAVIATLLPALAAFGGAVLAAYRYFAARDKIAAVRAAFDKALDDLSAPEAVRRQAGAILLRRFFDTKQEFGIETTPYADAALNVIAATLRGLETGHLQKLLADGLRLAPTLEGIDLQRTNLQEAYLAKKDGRDVCLRGADFFRSDLTLASLRGADASGAKFYQARLKSTVLREAILEGASFYDADLLGADFRDAVLDNADFAHARNIPPEIAALLDGSGKYVGTPVPREERQSTRITVFVSRPGAAGIETRQYIRALGDRIAEEGLDPIEIERAAYAETGAVSEVRRVMSGCAGAAVVAAPDLDIKDAVWRAATPDVRSLASERWASPWTSLELGVATGLGLPVLLVVADEISSEIFDFGPSEPGVYQVRLTEDHLSRHFREVFDDWVGAVRESSRR